MPPRPPTADEPSELELPDADGQLGDDDGLPDDHWPTDDLNLAEQTEELDDSAAHELTDGAFSLSFDEEAGLLDGTEEGQELAFDAGQFAEEENLLADGDAPGIEEEELDIEEAETQTDSGDEGPLTDDAELPAVSDAQLALSEADGEEGDEMESLLLFGRVPQLRQADLWHAELVLRGGNVADLCLTEQGPLVAGDSLVALDHAGLERFRVASRCDEVAAAADAVVVRRGTAIFCLDPARCLAAVEAVEPMRAIAAGARVLSLAESGALYVTGDGGLRKLRGDVLLLGHGGAVEGSVFLAQDPGPEGTTATLHHVGEARPVAAPPHDVSRLEVFEDRAFLQHDGGLLELVGRSWERYALPDEPIVGACYLDDGDVAFVVAAGDVLAVLRRSEGELSQLGQLPCVDGPVHLRWDVARKILWIGGAFGVLRLQQPGDA